MHMNLLFAILSGCVHVSSKILRIFSESNVYQWPIEIHVIIIQKSNTFYFQIKTLVMDF